MITTYFRSSSYNRWDWCEQLFFGEYVLGWTGMSGIKADKGTIVHKVLEIMARAKKAKQDGYDGYREEELKINGKRKVEYATMDPDNLTENVFAHYAINLPHHPWSAKDERDCKLWVNKALEYKGGAFDPRNRTIVEAEPFFDFEIDEDWANYQFKYMGQNIQGKLSLKGTIDLITKVDDGVYEIVDWKTGRRLNWATGQEKTQKCLQEDPQLQLYHYAASRLYPEAHTIMVTIFFINDGGAFTVYYDKNDLKRTEQIIQKRYNDIRMCSEPRLSKSWKCSKLCPLGKTSFVGTHIKPLQEFRDGQATSKGQIMTKCEQLKFEIQKKGMAKVNDEYTKPGFDVGYYQAPGSTDRK